ncbi:hypothetical protein [Pseudogemmobacter sonorensis]|uniref:hypothetical protein n=1 Tax=Pseudogemmobacter sonorensis TaxID=2989681 RepID=UPI0036A7F764
MMQIARREPHINKRSGSIEIAQYCDRITPRPYPPLSPTEAHAADVEARRWSINARFEALPIPPKRPRSRLRPGHIFALIFTSALIVLAWHMSDAYARGLHAARQAPISEEVR